MSPESPQVGDFALGAQLGQGGWGAVYAATHGPTGVQAAVKLLPCRTPGQAARLQRELAALARLRHRHILQIFDHGLSDGVAWLATERARSSLAGAALPPAQLRPVAQALLDALAHAHARGVIHRDIKPDNLLWSVSGELRLADLGAAWLADSAPLDPIGTPGFMAPEQAADTPWMLGPWTDLYAVGKTILGATDDPGWRAWALWLAQPDPAARPQSAAAALASMPAHGARHTFTLPATATVTQPAGTEGARTPGPAAPPAASVLPTDWRRPLPPPDHLLRTVSSALVSLREPVLCGRQPLQDQLWAALAEQHGPRHLSLTGPAGVGRAALARWLGQRAAEAGATVWWARPDDDASTLLSRMVQAQRDDHDPARVAWQAHRRGAPQQAAEAITAGLASGAAANALATLLASEPGPRLIISERAPALRGWLSARMRGGVPVLIVEVGGDGEPVAVSPLRPAAMQALLSDLLPLTPRLRTALVERAEGRPGLAVRWLRALAEDGRLTHTAGAWDAPPAAWGRTDRWEARIADLGDDDRELLVQRALLGPLAPPLAPDAPAVLHEPEAAEAARRLATRGELLGAAATLDGLDRVDAHARRGALLRQAGALGAARDALKLACWGAMEAAAPYDEVLGHAEVLGEVLAALGQRDELDRRIHSVRMTCRARCGDLAGAEALAETYLAREGLTAAHRASATRMRALVAAFDGRAHDALALLDSIDDHSAEMDMHRAWVLDELGVYDQARELCARWPEQLDLQRSQAYNLFRRGHPAAALQAIGPILEAAKPSERPGCLHTQAWALWSLGRRAEARAAMAQAAAEGASSIDSLLPSADGAHFALLDGEVALARSLAERTLPRARAYGWRAPEQIALLVLWASAADAAVAASHARAVVQLRRGRHLSVASLGPLLARAAAAWPPPPDIAGELRALVEGP